MSTFQIKSFFPNGILPSFAGKGSVASDKSNSDASAVSSDKVSLSSEVRKPNISERQDSGKLSAGLAEAYGEKTAPAKSQPERTKPKTRDEILQDFRKRQLENRNKVNQRIKSLISS